MNVQVLQKNFNKLGVEMKIFLTLVLCTAKNGEFRVKKEEVSKYLNISKQTVGKYLKTFCDCNMIKYKYSGVGMFNPSFYATCDVQERPKAIERYEAFKSDM